MTYVTSFKDLEVYKIAREVSNEIYIRSKKFPSEEKYSLTDQIRRSSRSVGAQIAEAWGKKRYEKHFVSKLTDSDGEQLETQHWLETACECNYMTDEVSRVLIEKCEHIGKMLQTMIDKAPMFCQNR